ncbi:hypothetical protein ACNKHU_24620 [Shigella flexneri]
MAGVVGSALTEGLEVMGIYDGYLGLYEDRMVQQLGAACIT